MSKRIRSGDTVYITTGDDRGKTGKVLHKKEDRILVEGINICTKHKKPSGKDKHGEILKIEKPIHISNVRLCVQEDKPVKVTLAKAHKKEKELVYEVNGKSQVYRPILKPAKTNK